MVLRRRKMQPSSTIAVSAARPYQPLADYGVIGDFRTAVLVSRDGSIDWACLPRFDSPSVFGRIIDRHAGGFWQLVPHGDHVSAELRYVDDTAILETVHESAGGTARVTDLMVPPSQGDGPCILVRTCEGLAGSISLNSTFEPAFGYGGEPARIEPFGENGLLASAPNGPELRLVSTVDQRDREAVVALAPGERATFVLAVGGEPPRLAEAEAAAEQAAGWWRSWCKGVEYSGPYRDQVVRSAIVLKLLSHSQTGAMVAAPTTSLPEVVGGERNWDYRYTWLRDSSLSLYAWYAIGLRAEGDAFFDWICERVGDPEVESAGLKVMYDLDGGSDHAEHELERLEGYRESRPVRIGNAACEQVQLDVYGDVLDCFAS